MRQVSTKIISHTDYSSSFNGSVFSQIPPQSVCLDVGCSSGNLGAALIAHKDCRVHGIDVNLDALAQATQKGYEQVYALDLIREPGGLGMVPDLNFDCIICADVLEHLVNPELILPILANKLRPGGLMIVSLPNVAFGLNRLHLLLGNWNYREYGIMDKTHLRFYTIQSGIRLVKESGLEVLKVQPYNQFGVLRHLKLLDRLFPSFFAYQFIIVSYKK